VRYRSPFRPARNRPEWNQQQLRRALLGDGHAVGFGHVAVLPAEGMLIDGLTDTPGPARKEMTKVRVVLPARVVVI
jgi:hypothetical protein